MKMLQYQYTSLVGPIYLVASATGLCGLYWKKQKIEMVAKLNNASPEHNMLKQTIEQLKEYFQGTRTEFDIPIAMLGTEFQKSVWQQLSKIPYGSTCSYTDIAKRLKNPKAVRAVGTANGRNPISIIVPCHRVIGLNGQLTGYAGGLKVKQRLLELEAKSHEVK